MQLEMFAPAAAPAPALELAALLCGSCGAELDSWLTDRCSCGAQLAVDAFSAAMAALEGEELHHTTTGE